jgi:uncharacterized membrane protein
MRIASVGHAFFAATFIGLGILGLIKGDFAPVWAPVPQTVPSREVLVYLAAFVSLVSGLGLLWKRTAALAALLLLACLLLWILFFRVPAIFHAPTKLDPWFGLGETAVSVAAAKVLYAWFATDRRSNGRPGNGNDSAKLRLGFTTGEKGLRLARIPYGLAMIPFGVGHFIYLKETAGLVPNWLPWHLAWAYFFGFTFLAAGVAILIGVCARLAATLSAFQIGMFTVLVWIPIVAAGSKNAFVWSETILSVALTAGAWVVADSYRAIPWLATNKR